MTSWEIILILAGIPLGTMILLGLLTLGPNLRRAPAYRPGDEWDHPPVWWMANASLQYHGAGHHDSGQHDHGSGGTHGGARGDW